MTAPLFIVSDDPAANDAVTVAHAAYRQAEAAFHIALDTYDAAARAYYRRSGVNSRECAAVNAAHRALVIAYNDRQAAHDAWRAAFNALTDKGDTL